MTDTFTIKKIPDVLPFTIEELSKMTMVQIMDSMNHYRKLSISNHNDKIELIQLKKKMYKLTKPKRKQIKATKSDLQRWLGSTESVLMGVIETNYANADPYEINSMFDEVDGRYNKRLRPQFRGISISGYPDKVDIDAEY
mgnify:CR=1 FL=1